MFEIGYSLITTSGTAIEPAVDRLHNGNYKGGPYPSDPPMRGGMHRAPRATFTFEARPDWLAGLRELELRNPSAIHVSEML